METLGACPATRTTLAEGPYSFKKHLAAELIFLAGRNRSISVDQLNSVLLQDWRYRARNKERDGDAAYAGNVRVLNAGNHSIRLAKLPTKVRLIGSNGKSSSTMYGTEVLGSESSNQGSDGDVKRSDCSEGGCSEGRS